jgi:hypothetical protein
MTYYLVLYIKILLDPFLVSNLDIVIDSEVINVNRDISDHDATLINIKNTLFTEEILYEKSLAI